VRAAMGLIGRRDRVEDLPERLLQQRDALRRAFSSHPWLAFLAALGKWGFDYLALLCVLAALSLNPEPAFVLLAFAAASILGMIPLTPGGLGFVEAGLAGLLVLAGVGAGDAAVATLAYRLVSFWLPLPAGVVAWWLARRRYGPVEPEASAATTSSSSSDAATSPP
jgi:putative heme transporter